MKVEITFNDTAIKDNGIRKTDIYHTIKNAFAKHDLPCLSDGNVLAFGDKCREDDYAYMWNVIKSLMISDWFLKCAASCNFIDDENTEEDVLSQAHLFKKRNAV